MKGKRHFLQTIFSTLSLFFFTVFKSIFMMITTSLCFSKAALGFLFKNLDDLKEKTSVEVLTILNYQSIS